MVSVIFESDVMARGQGLFWRGMKDDCAKCVEACLPCLNISKHGFHPLKPIHAELPMDHVAFDLKEFPRSAEGYIYMLVLVEICTKFVFLRPLPNKTMDTISNTLFEAFYLLGFPKIIQSDNGTEFVNQVIKALTTTARIDHRLITPYNPRANGAAERYVQTASNAILKELQGHDDQWDGINMSIPHNSS
jgi:transposase InsO family protein